MQQQPRRQHCLSGFGQVAASAVMCAALIGVSLMLAAPARAAITAVSPSATSVTTTVGAPITDVTFTTAGVPPGTPITFAPVGALPAGLALDPTAGTLTGSPTAAGSFSITVTATDPGPDLTVTTDDTTVTSPVVTVNVAGLTPTVQPPVVGVVGVALTTATLTTVGFPPAATPTFAVTP
ncbi:MAG: putative Ig domain-containing protein, partial [Actinobacteria bacterium]|nr:putative Ig domain-containing protein [Actinomycetota bacterium]